MEQLFLVLSRYSLHSLASTDTFQDYQDADEEYCKSVCASLGPIDGPIALRAIFKCLKVFGITFADLQAAVEEHGMKIWP
jgi:hypothetical protein